MVLHAAFLLTLVYWLREIRVYSKPLSVSYTQSRYYFANTAMMVFDLVIMRVQADLK